MECFFYKFLRFIFTRTISYDFSVIEVAKNTYVIPMRSYPYICQIAYHNIPVRQIAGSGYFRFWFVTGVFPWFKLCGCVIGNQSFLLHDPSDPEFSACFTHFSNSEWERSYSLQISHLLLPQRYKSTNCCSNSSVYLRSFLRCFVSVILFALLLIDFILYNLKKSVQFIVAYPSHY